MLKCDWFLVNFNLPKSFIIEVIKLCVKFWNKIYMIIKILLPIQITVMILSGSFFLCVPVHISSYVHRE